MTVDSAQKIGQRLNAEELKECFTLKETCICDTRNKVGKKWPDYSKLYNVLTIFAKKNQNRWFLTVKKKRLFPDGEESLLSQGCSDQALLAVAAKDDSENPPLAFVHIVKEDECHGDKGEEAEADSDEADYDDNDNDDEEFEMEDDDDNGTNNHKVDSVGEATSDEEFEFE